MRVHMENSGNDWRIMLIPDDEIERAIIKQKNGCTATVAKDLKTSGGQHVADCLIIAGKDVPAESLQP